MFPVVLFRPDPDNGAEMLIAQKHFDVVTHRAACPPNSLIIPRYSALPFYRELEQDIQWNNSELLNSWCQHRWIANFDYYHVLRDFTPETWDDMTFCHAPKGRYVVKGRTNSRKFEWDMLMHAFTKRRASEIANELMKDPLIGPQGVIYRKYVPLRTFGIGLNGLPFTNEWRFFFYKTNLLSYGYYWSSFEFDVSIKLPTKAVQLANEIAKLCEPYVNFFVLDLAETETGEWILIEVNDGQMSGLSENDPNMLYSNLRSVL